MATRNTRNRGSWNASLFPGETMILDLDGYINGKSEQLPPPPYIQPDIIHGCTMDGKNITLYQCNQASSNIPFMGYGASSFIAHYGFIGVIFNKPEEIKFECISISFSNLNEWANKKSLDFEFTDNFDVIKVKYETPKSYKAAYKNFEFSIRFSSKSSFSQEIHIVPDARFDIKSLEDEKIFEDYLGYIRPLQDLLSLATNTATYPINIYGITSVNNMSLEGGQIRNYPPVDIIFPPAWWPEKIEKQYSALMLFNLNEIEDEFTKYISNWLDKYAELKPVMSLYFSVMYQPHSAIEVKFLSVAQALETYHHRAYGGQFQPKKLYRDGINKILSAALPQNLDSDFLDNIESRIRYGYEYSFKKRLTELTQQLSDSLLFQDYHEFEFINIKENRDEFISLVVYFRNHFTHYDDEDQLKTIQNLDLYNLIVKMHLLLEICLLKELGLSLERISKIIFKSKRFRYLTGQIL